MVVPLADEVEFSEEEWRIFDLYKTGMISMHSLEKMLWDRGFLPMGEIDLEVWGKSLEAYHHLYPN